MYKEPAEVSHRAPFDDGFLRTGIRGVDAMRARADRELPAGAPDGLKGASLCG